MSAANSHALLVPTDGVALVTGASRGIGRAVAMKLAAAGRPVALLARSAEALASLADEVRSLGGRVEFAVCDLTETDTIRPIVDDLSRRLGPVRVLVNNAGVFLDRPMPDIELRDWERVLRVNLTASFVLTQAVWPQMVRAGGGVVVNVASKAAVQGYAGQSAYCASKAGLLGWARALALEGRLHRIRVHNICPGGVDTDLIAGTALADRLKGQVMLQAEDVADVVLFCVDQPANVDLPDLLMARFQV